MPDNGGIIGIISIPIIASGEAARRYYSTKQFEITGVSNVFLPFPPVVDAKFMDISNTWFRYDKDPLKTSIEKFAKFPIATNYGEDDHQKQPRLLLVSVDVQEGATVTFDSYPKKDGSRKSQYGESGLEFGDNVEEEEKGYNTSYGMMMGLNQIMLWLVHLYL